MWKKNFPLKNIANKFTELENKNTLQIKYLDLTLLGQTKWDLPAYVTGTLLGSLLDVQR